MKIIEHQIPRGPNGEKDLNDWDSSGMWDEMMSKVEKSAKDPFDWSGGFELTEQELEQIAAPQWAYENLLVQGHYLVLCAAPNHGKTTIMLYVSGCLAEAGYKVMYINADVAGSDAKPMHYYAVEHGFSMLFPDMKVGKGIDDIMGHLQAMAVEQNDLSGYVIVIDTLKKITSLMDKRNQQTLYTLIRRLTAQGLTICVNSHTNKYSAADGAPVYEGTNDVRSDCDELIYLVGEKDPTTGEMVVSTVPDKVRASFKPISFTIDAKRDVSRADEYVDVITEAKLRRQHEEDMDRIALIEDVLRDGAKNQGAVAEAVKGQMNHKTARRVLRAYGGAKSYRQHWHSEKTFQRNEFQYWLVEAAN